MSLNVNPHALNRNNMDINQNFNYKVKHISKCHNTKTNHYYLINNDQMSNGIVRNHKYQSRSYPKRTLYHTPKSIPIIEIPGMLKANTKRRVTATKSITIGPLNGLINQTMESHQLTADGEESRREHTPM